MPTTSTPRVEVWTGSKSRLGRVEVTSGVAVSRMSRLELVSVSGARTLTPRLEVSTAITSASGLLGRLEVYTTASPATTKTTRLAVNIASVHTLTPRLAVTSSASAATSNLSRLELFIIAGAHTQTSKIAVSTASLTAAIAPINSAAEARSTVTLNGSISSGSPTTYAWSQISGTPVNLLSTNAAYSGFIAPATIAGDTLVFQLIVASPGQTSSSAQISVAINPQINWAASGGTWKPVYWKNLS